MKSLATWKLILSSLNRNIPVMLLYVVENSGSSPGRQGFNMAINMDGDMEGSVGGGIMEHKFVELAKSKLAANESGSSLHKQVHNKTAAIHQSGMICSGEQSIVLYSVRMQDKPVVEALISCLDQEKTGQLSLSPRGIYFDGSINNKTSFELFNDIDWQYSETIGFKNRLFIIGAGHCALALSRIMRPMDFYMHLFDDRNELKTMLENDFVNQKEILEDYSQLFTAVDSHPDNYFVIMTFGYRTDAIALRALLKKEFAYIGMLGSKAKTEKMMEDLSGEGFEPALLKRIHAPIGLPIKSKTPEEVAISIAAEIISIKNFQ